ncbi:MAG: FAD binding domain-containing protein, partial [Actinomycetota bacterium]|nr:FAD binding domain-containing protein [Actinomycetota bacterium]
MEFCRADTLDEALASLDRWGTAGRVLAGGTDLMLQQRQGETPPEALIHIGNIDALSTISTGTRTTIGPLVTHRTLATDPDLGTRHPALSTAAGMVGGWQTQAVGTLG